MSGSAAADTPHLLVIRRRYLGDIVLLGSVFRNLRLHWPGVKITALVEAPYAGVLALHPDVDARLTFPNRLGEWWAFLRRVRAGAFTHVLDFDNTEKTSLLTRLTGAAVRATFHRELIRFRHRFFYTHHASIRNDFYSSSHITETYLHLPAAIGVPIVTREVRLTPRPADLAFAQNLLSSRHSSLFSLRSRLLVHPGSRSPHRLWPIDRFAHVIDRAQRELRAQVALIAGPGEKPLVADIVRQCAIKPEVIDAPFSIPQLAALLYLFPVLLCHDSGPMHLAAAVGARVVALYGSQNAAIWRPLGDHHAVLQTPLPCACLPDAPKRCVKHDSYRSYCVRKLSEEEVLAAVAKALR